MMKNEYITQIGYRALKSFKSLGISETDKTDILNHEILCSSQECQQQEFFFLGVVL